MSWLEARKLAGVTREELAAETGENVLDVVRALEETEDRSLAGCLALALCALVSRRTGERLRSDVQELRRLYEAERDAHRATLEELHRLRERLR